MKCCSFFLNNLSDEKSTKVWSIKCWSIYINLSSLEICKVSNWKGSLGIFVITFCEWKKCVFSLVEESYVFSRNLDQSAILFLVDTMRTNLPKLLDLLIFCIYSLNSSFEFFIMIFVTNQLNISKFLPPQIRKTLISY